MERSETLKEIAGAMTKAQATIEKADKDRENPHFRSKYADLGNVVDAIKPALAENGLSFIQVCHDADEAAKVETVILHSSGEWLSCGVISVPVSKKDAQGFGSALTYARRYSLAAAFGVAPEDDDGNAAAKAAPKAANRQQEKPKQPAATEESGDLNAAQTLYKELAEFCRGDEAVMEEALKEYSEFSGKFLTLFRIHNPDEDHEKRARLLKWCGATLDKLRKARAAA